MKKFCVFTVCFSAMLLSAGFDLGIRKFGVPAGGSAEIVKVDRDDWGLRLTAEKYQDVRIVYSRVFHFVPLAKYEVEAAVKGEGTAFIEIQFFDANNNHYANKSLDFTISKQVKNRYSFQGLSGELNLMNRLFDEPPATFKVVVGVKAGGSVIFSDIELDIDND